MTSSVNAAPWESLFDKAMTLIDQVTQDIHFQWSFGGGTVLMFRLNHRRSKDIDIFIPDPQILGMFSPRLNDNAHSLTNAYVETGGSLKLLFPEGEVDFVVAENLTQRPFELAKVRGRDVFLETPAEVIAKKMWHRGHLATGRDLFDLAAVATFNEQLLEDAKPAMKKNASVFLQQCSRRRDIVKAQYENIDVIDFQFGFDESLEIARSVLEPLAA